MRVTVNTQTLENYGAHTESGKFEDQKHYWKFKGGTTYFVDGCDRIQDAVAFIASVVTHNNIMFKEFVTDYHETHQYPSSFSMENTYDSYVKLDVKKFMEADIKSRNKMLSDVVYPEND
jgi:hypothetical protein|tara:strand:+ start:469 stop:825 length:357 start_codon:yes stop_codon:yes gene_type:complete